MLPSQDGPPQQALRGLPLHAGRQQRSHGPCTHMLVRLAKPPAAHEPGMLPVRALLLSRSVVSWAKPPDPHAGGSGPMKLWPLRKSEARDLQSRGTRRARQPGSQDHGRKGAIEEAS